MALVCDYCGDVTEAAERVQVAFGHNQEIALKGATAQEWFHYCEGDCADAVKAMLDNLRLFAMHGEGSGLMWQLVNQKRAPEQSDFAPVDLSPPKAIRDLADKAKPKPVRADDREQQERDREHERRKGRMTLTRHLAFRGQDTISAPEFRVRRERGTPVDQWVTHQGARGKLREANILTLEDVAALTEVEFMGVPGVGEKIARYVKEGLAEAGLMFAPGPSPGELGLFLRDRRERGGFTYDDLIPVILDAIDAPHWVHPGDSDGGGRSRAWSDCEELLKGAESGTKFLPPVALDALAGVYEIDRSGLLVEASRV